MLEGKMSTVPSWLAAVTVSGNWNISATGTEIMGEGTSTQISLKALLQREIETGRKKEVFWLRTSHITMDLEGNMVST